MYTIGIDLGGTNIAVGLCDEELRIVDKGSVPTLAEREGEEIVKDMAALTMKIVERNSLSLADIDYVGIAAPGCINSDAGIVEYTNNIKMSDFPLVEIFKKYCPVERVYIANDANAAALGEALAGVGKGMPTLVMITLGTGVGGGVILDGKIFAGGKNPGGTELGHTVISAGGRQCSCGRRGCWEAYSSATALIRMTKEKIAECEAEGRYTVMSKAERISGRTACDAMRAGDEAGKEVYDKYVKYLAAGLTNMINIFQPQVISLGGGVSNEGQSLIDALIPQIRAEQYGGSFLAEKELTEIRIAKLGNDAGIIGAAALA